MLHSLGYTWLDVRPALEYEDAGKVKGSVNVSIMNMTKTFVGDGPAADKKKVYVKSPNTEFVNQVRSDAPTA